MEDHIFAFNQVLKFGFKGYAARREYKQILDRINKKKIIENNEKINFINELRKSSNSFRRNKVSYTNFDILD